MSVSYLAKIEQGIQLRPSEAALDNLAQTLSMSDADLKTLYFLAERATPTESRRLDEGVGFADIERMGEARVALFDAAFTPLATNALFRRTFFGVDEHLTSAEWLFFDSRSRIVYEDWEAEARRTVWWLRQVAPKKVAGPLLSTLVDRMIAQPDFARLWRDPSMVIDTPSSTIRLRDYHTRKVFLFGQSLYKRLNTASPVYSYVAIPATSFDSH